MQQILRNLYQNHSTRNQTNRNRQHSQIEKLLVKQDSHKARSVRKEYYFRSIDIDPTTPTQNSVSNQITLHSPKFPAPIPNQSKPIKIHQKNKIKKTESFQKQVKYKPLFKLRAAVKAIIFLNHLRSKYRSSLILIKNQCEQCSKTMLMRISALVKGYYSKLLQNQLKAYINILEESLEFPHINQEKPLIQLVYYITQKLSDSTVTKDILQFLVNVSTQNSFPPSDFLSILQINNLQFSYQYGCLINVTAQQTKMVVGLALAIKIFCFYVLMQPWELNVASQKVKRAFSAKYQKPYFILKEKISMVSFCFYYIVFELITSSLKSNNKNNSTRLQQFGIFPILQLDPFGQKRSEKTDRHLIIDHSRQYLVNMEHKYPKIVLGIKEHLLKWIHRITYVCLKTKKASKKIVQQNTTGFVSINSARKGYQNPPAFRSLQLRKSAQKSDMKQSLVLPRLKRTL